MRLLEGFKQRNDMLWLVFWKALALSGLSGDLSWRRGWETRGAVTVVTHVRAGEGSISHGSSGHGDSGGILGLTKGSELDVLREYGRHMTGGFRI